MPSKRERTPAETPSATEKESEEYPALFKKFQCVLEKQEHSGRTILRNAKRFNKPDTVHKHAQPIPVRPQTPGPPNQIALLQGKVHAVSGRFGTDLEFVEKIQTATESFAAPAAAKGERRYDTEAARQHTQPEVRFPKAPYPQNEGRIGPFHRLILSVIGKRDSLDLTDFPYRRQFLAVIRDQHGSRVAQLHNELFLKVDIQGVPFMHDALAVFAVRGRRNPAIALRRQQHTVTGGGKSRLRCRRPGFSGKRGSTQNNRFL